VLPVPHTDPARYRCGTKQSFLPEVPACATPAQVAAATIKGAQSEPLTRLPFDRNVIATLMRLSTSDHHSKI
jgi:hypothetical protein